MEIKFLLFVKSTQEKIVNFTSHYGNENLQRLARDIHFFTVDKINKWL